MVAANPFKPKEKVDISDLDLNKIIEEEKIHNHGQGVSDDTALPGAAELEKTTEAIKEEAMKNEKSPFIKTPEVEEKKLVIKDEPDEIVEEKVEATKDTEIEPKPEVEDETKPEVEKEPEAEKKPVSFSKLPMPKLDNLENSKAFIPEPVEELPVLPTEEVEDKLDNDLGEEPAELTADDELAGFEEEPISAEEDNTVLDLKQVSFATKAKKWLWKYRWPFIILAILALVALVGYMANKSLNKIEMNIPSDGLRITYENGSYGNKVPSELRVRVLAYNADTGSNKELLYFVDTLAKANPDGTMNISWDVPSSAISTRGTYNEFCVLDEARVDAEVNDYCGGYGEPQNAVVSTVSSPSGVIENFNRVSCAYYIPPHTTGLISFLSGWNKLNESQKVGCSNDDDKVWGVDSYIETKYESEKSDETGDNNIEINNISTTEYFFNNNYSNEGADHVVYQFTSTDKSVQYRRWASGYQELYARMSVSMRAGVGAIGSNSDWWQYNDVNFNSVWASSDKKGVFDFASLGIPEFKSYNDVPVAQCGVSNSDMKLVTLDKITRDSAVCWAGDSGNGGDKTITYNLSATGFYDINS